MPEFEVRCHDCNVGFPPGTRRCLYCGGRPSASPRPDDRPSIREILGRRVAARELSQEEPHRDLAEFDLDADVEEEQDSRKASLARLAGNLVWIALLVVISVYRACAGG